MAHRDFQSVEAATSRQRCHFRVGEHEAEVFLFCFICICVYVLTHLCVGAHRGQEGELDPWSLQLQAVLRSLTAPNH